MRLRSTPTGCSWDARPSPWRTFRVRFEWARTDSSQRLPSRRSAWERLAGGAQTGEEASAPLCTSGYGLGTQLWPVAGGATLLFLTNLVAIIFVGTLSFL